MTLHKYTIYIVTFLIIFFTFLSFLPTIYELTLSKKLNDPNREFVLEHNYYWPDFNLYLSKIRQGTEGHLLAKELYSSEPHEESLIQVFYVGLGQAGRLMGLDPNFSYQFGRLILAPVLLLVIFLLCQHVFKNSRWQIIGFIVVVISGSFPKFITDTQGNLVIQRYMEWWSNIDSLQRIAFIPHILLGQILSFTVFLFLIKKNWNITPKDIAFFAIVGNILGLVFPPSLITLNTTILLIALIHVLKTRKLRQGLLLILFIAVSAPSQIYIALLTKQVPWSALVHVHQINHMLIPFTEYLLALGPVVFLALIGIGIAMVKKEKRVEPFILWLVITYFYTILFTYYKEQSPLRFTQTGIHIPLGILATYAIFQVQKVLPKTLVYLFLLIYIVENLFVMKLSWDWQSLFITLRAKANIPAVPYPPQTLHPLTHWMDAIRWLKNNTNREDVVLTDITAGNYIPAYTGNVVYFGQVNTYDYDRKYVLLQRFYIGAMTWDQAYLLLKEGRIKYIFFGPQEKERAGFKNLEEYYSFLKPVYQNDTVTLYTWY